MCRIATKVAIFLITITLMGTVSRVSANPTNDSPQPTKLRENLRLLPTCTTGKYSSGSTCKSCSATCKGCVTSSTKCTSCQTGKYLSGNSCYTCPSSCSACSSSIKCTACVTSYTLSPSGACQYDSSLDPYASVSSSDTSTGSSSTTSTGSTSSSSSSSSSRGSSLSSSSSVSSSTATTTSSFSIVGIIVGSVIFVVFTMVCIIKHKKAAQAAAKPGEVISSDSGIASPSLGYGSPPPSGDVEMGLTFAPQRYTGSLHSIEV